MNLIKRHLETSGRKQKYLAEKMDMSYQQINEWCNNKRQPSIENLFRIAEILGVEAKELLVNNKDVKN